MHSLPHSTAEAEANKFAGEFLMPGSEIKSSLRNIRLPELAALKRYWKVSMQALLVRAGELGAVDFYQQDRLWRQFSKLGYKTREPIELDLPKEHPSLLLEISRAYLDDLQYTTKDFAQFVGLHEAEANAYYLHPEKRLRLLV